MFQFRYSSQPEGEATRYGKTPSHIMQRYFAIFRYQTPPFHFETLLYLLVTMSSRALFGYDDMNNMVYHETRRLDPRSRSRRLQLENVKREDRLHWLSRNSLLSMHLPAVVICQCVRYTMLLCHMYLMSFTRYIYTLSLVDCPSRPHISGHTL